ncbi:MAG: hypothetical protein DCF21_17135 [Leptolyngbya sp.]|nr:MAG: hypothetical protein DCF21_17135 [Leptolyngbya sp.]
MNLTYRGISYDSASSPAPQMGETTGTGRYRGVPLVFRALANLPAQPANHLTWRGVPYRAGIMVPPPRLLQCPWWRFLRWPLAWLRLLARRLPWWMPQRCPPAFLTWPAICLFAGTSAAVGVSRA